MRTVLAAAPQALPALRSLCRSVSVAHMAYSLSPDGQLLRSANVSGGLMGIGGAFPSALSNRSELCRKILGECRARRFFGVLTDFENIGENPDIFVFSDELGSILARDGRKLFVPQSCAVPSAQILICTAISGGTLEELLLTCADRYGRERLALDCQRLTMDFTLPCRSGTGSAITEAQRLALQERCGSPAFFSKELGCSYFSYQEAGRAHFVAFDTAPTLRYKRELGEKLGIETAFFMYPEVSDLLGDLFP